MDATSEFRSCFLHGAYTGETCASCEIVLDDEPIHRWFELSYAQYLTVPRSVLQSMPIEWQRRFVQCLEELDDAIDWRPTSGFYRVQLKDSDGRYARDPFQDYERGRRRIPLRKPQAEVIARLVDGCEGNES